MKAFYAARRRTFDTANLKQVHFPEGSTVLPNPVGTAAGFRCSIIIGSEERHILSIPGVPHEMRKMCDEQVLPFLRSTFGSPAPLQSRTLRVFGIPESKIGAIVEQDGVPPAISVSYRAHYPEVIVKFSTRTDRLALESFSARSEAALGSDFVFSHDPQASLARVVHELLAAKGLTVSVAESCTGGALGEALTETPGSSHTFLGGVISYSNEAKMQLLGVPESTLLAHGAVSAETACAMADGVRERFKSSLAVSITGIAGPDGGTTVKPVGTFYIGLSTPDSTRAFHCFTAASRTLVRRFAAFTALDIIRRHVQGYELRPIGIIGAPQN
jgi:nicotinamide-nucleotide amidase